MDTARYAGLDGHLDSDDDDHTHLRHKSSIATDHRTIQYSLVALIGTAVLSIIALIAGVALTIASFNGSGGFLRRTNISSTWVSFSELAVNVLVTLCIDGTGFIHATSLRWALYRERRLTFNTNMRLLTASRSEFRNGRIVNTLSTASLVLCYATTSALWVRQTEDDEMRINTLAILLLGAALLGQVAVGCACFWDHKKRIGTWSSHPLNNALIALQGKLFIRQKGRCLHSFLSTDEPSTSRRPQLRQPRLLNLRVTKLILVFAWVLALAVWGWFAGLVKIITRDYAQDFRWLWEDVESDYTLTLDMGGETNVSVAMGMEPPSFNVQVFLAILFLCALQGFQAIGLHCVELLVNLDRDEKLWRAASGPKGAALKSLPLLAALKNWENCLLFALKPALHWLMGASIFPTFGEYGFSFQMSYSRLLVYGVGCVVAASFATFLAARRPRGYQPATWGHLQTIINCVDEWSEEMWWGDKGELDKAEEDGACCRHAGFASNRCDVAEIRGDALYA